MSPYFMGGIGRSITTVTILLAATQELPRNASLHGGVLQHLKVGRGGQAQGG